MDDAAFRLLFEASPHPYLVLLPGAGFKIAAVNDRYLAATGTKRDEIVGRGLFEVFPDNPDDATISGVSDLRYSLERVLHDQVQDIMGVQKYDIPRQGGEGFEVRYWSPVNTPVFGKDGKIVSIIHHVEDVTEFIVSQERASQESAERLGRVREDADRMQSEVMRRSADVKEVNRQLKAAKDELERREAELERMNERLTTMDRAKTEFFSDVSHEFRTPLTLMLGPLEKLIAECKAGADIELLRVAHRNALRLLKLVNSLLDFSRIEAGHVHPVRAPVDLSKLTADLASNFRSACDAAEVSLEVDCRPLPGPVAVDAEMWEKIVLNLLSNAFKFTLKGSIALTLRAGDGIAELAVRDTGCGIAETDLPGLFKRFHRVKGASGRSQEGSGIGLALVEELVRLHGGSVGVVSEPGVGSAFTVRIPFESPESAVSDSVAVPAPSPPPNSMVMAFTEEARRWLPDVTHSVSGERRPANTPACQRIVLADDNADMRDYLRGLLEAAGYEAVVVADGEAAFAACMAAPPDLVLSDVMMPRLDGTGLLHRLRTTPSTAIVPIILVSARAGEDAMVGGFDAGADDYLVKPFDARQLIARVNSTLRMADFRQKAAAQKRDIAVLEARLEEQQAAADALRQAYEEVAKARDAAEASNRAKSAFLASMSHELRTPLSAILGFSQVLEMKAMELTKDRQICIAHILTSGRHLLDLVNDLLDMSRIEAGQIKLDVTEVPVAPLVESVLVSLRPMAEQAGIALSVSLDRNLPDIRGDEIRLRQIMLNLGTNAIKYNRKCGSVVIVGSRVAGGQVRLSVVDTGTGIPSERQHEVFEPFNRLGREAGSIEGTGVGLALSRRLTHLMDGTIGFSSTPGKGSRFWVEIPPFEPARDGDKGLP